ncbi:hypothetical protein RJ640_011356 [Escallonia rubra]|uniref:Protein kinase domain-containing protein n=1 Tax=Escallonia rubra TaxID=112253 RepID=A0AA88QQ16_9ASTE|nr:hypothetical protein RJ640_011356 [Escallonia rubra]
MFPFLISDTEKPIKSGNKSASPNKDGYVVQEIPPSGQNVTQKVKVFTFAELNIAMGYSLLEPGRAFWVNEKTYAPSKAGIGMAITFELLERHEDLLGVQKGQDFNAKLIGFGIDLVCHNEIRDMAGYNNPNVLFSDLWVPEYNGNVDSLTVNSDVYGFGVVLVQILTGRQAHDRSRPFPERNLVSWVRPFLGNVRKHKMIMDARLEDGYPSRGASQVALLARSCLVHDPELRPSMEEVLEVLKNVRSWRC